MKVTMFWHGGSSYAVFDPHSADDAEVFNSINAAKRAFSAHTNDRYYPCVDTCDQEHGGASAWLFFGDSHPVTGQEYPDRVMSFGPRGGIKVERT
jgi:hypothetical protein